MLRIKALCLLFFMWWACSLLAQVPQSDTLPNVKVAGIKAYHAATAAMPVQLLTQSALKKLNAENVADAAKYFSGVLVKDYGGMGGLKTVSVRSLGANHTAVLYDGIILGDAQAGQIDLGRYPLENLYTMALQQAQPAEILNTARAFSATSVILLKTIATAPHESFKKNFSAAAKVGSFNTYNYYATLQLPLRNNWGTQISGSRLTSQGDYTFKDYEKNGSTRRRMNGDIKALTGEANIFYRNKDQSLFHFKTYYYQSQRGLPGSIILYNYFSNERLNDQNIFLQSSYKNRLSEKTDILLNAKYSLLWNHYLKPAATASTTDYENTFHQHEYYGSVALRHRFSKKISAAYAGDYFYNYLNRTDAYAQNFAFPSRYTWLHNLALKYELPHAEILSGVLFTHVANTVRNGKSAGNFQRWSPVIAATVQPLASMPLRLRFFYKNIFRVPTFNDLYYTLIGNTSLRPEVANQYNIGVTYKPGVHGIFKTISFSADAYYNHVNDKIVAVPRENLFQWSMQNIGIVNINGLDLSGEGVFDFSDHFYISLNGNYTYQQSIDKTDAQSVLYNNPIAYTPKHSGSFRMGADYRNFSFGYSMLFSSYRFRVGEMLESNYLPGWSVSDVNIRYKIPVNKMVCYLFLEANNIFNRQYDIIMYYPMPGIHFRTGIKIERNGNF